MTVDHDETVGLSFADPETRKEYVRGAMEDFVRGNLDDSKAILRLYLRVLGGFPAAAKAVGVSASELEEALSKDGEVSSRCMSKLLAYLSKKEKLRVIVHLEAQTADRIAA